MEIFIKDMKSAGVASVLMKILSEPAPPKMEWAGMSEKVIPASS